MSSFLAIYRVIVAAVATKGRILLLGGLSLVAVVVGLVIGANDPFEPTQAGADLVNGFGLALLAPVVALVFASAALGDMTDDNTLVYIWLRPVPRETIALAAVAAAVSVSLPIVVIPLVAAALLASGGDGSLAAGIAVASAISVLAYAGLFVALGLRIRRALSWGITYILIWEGFVARAGDGAARLSIQTYARSVLADAADVELRLAGVAPVAAVVVPVLVSMVGVALTTRFLHRRDVA